MGRVRARSVAEAIIGCLATRGTAGATLVEIYEAVDDDLGEAIPHASVRADLYKRLVGSETAYRSRFERFTERGQTRYRLAKRIQ